MNAASETSEDVLLAGPERPSSRLPQRGLLHEALGDTQRAGPLAKQVAKQLQVPQPRAGGLTGERRARLNQIAHLYKPEAGAPKGPTVQPPLNKALEVKRFAPMGRVRLAPEVQPTKPPALASRSEEEATTRKREGVAGTEKAKPAPIPQPALVPTKRPQEEEDEEAKKKREAAAKTLQRMAVRHRGMTMRKEAEEAQRREARKLEELRTSRYGASQEDLQKEAEKLFKQIDEAAEGGKSLRMSTSS